ncbi:CPBP family intramembrane metalloprotease [Labedella phragmitis]|uniref:CPBP family intramembrane metalloprotease n=1 Tax=Labedella phragmitis TaxID=2498849 RepID=A0A444PQG3_9MICO|nr:CPBP family intramembrane glutamic endopeptidase [Labedella phragmitis]RWZ46606.1 CPBP family intramembrane metalloprotease [Labedella phragmitis]
MLPYIRTGIALDHAAPDTVAGMSSPRQWSLLVPLIGLALAVVLLPVATARWVPFAVQQVLGYLVVWVPLVAATVAAVIVASRRSGERWWIAMSLRSTLTGVLLGAFVGLALRSIALVVEILGTGRIAGGSVGIGGGPGLAQVVAVVVATAIVAPIIEEVFFRGVLLPAVVERSGPSAAGPWVGVVVTAALFAGVHALAGADLLGTVVTFVAGIGFGFVARSSGLVAAVVAHVVFNSSGIALVLANTPVSPLGPTLGLG